MSEETAIVILAAGKGSRMKSDLPKVMHKVAGLPLISYVVTTAELLEPTKIITVIAPGMEQTVGVTVAPHPTVLQTEQRGTGHAVSCAKEKLKGFKGKVLIMFGDVPLVQADTMQAMLETASKLPEKPGVMLLGFRPDDPSGYGRIIMQEDGTVKTIVEQADANEEQQEIDLCWSGIMLVDGEYLFDWLEEVDDKNAQGEIYMVDVVAIAARHGRKTYCLECHPSEVRGVNTKAQLADIEFSVQQFLREKHLENGVTLLDPQTTYFSLDTEIGTDCVIEPNVFFGGGVEIGDGVHIHAYSYLEHCIVQAAATVGPFARLRQGTVLEEGASVGNFVEMKESTLGRHSKAKHLSYIGNTKIGEKSNIGAGTIFCNYNGYQKQAAIIGNNVMIGSNSSIISPVTINDDAYVGAGSVITSDVECGALGITRSKQENKKDWSHQFHKKMKARKKTD